MAIDLNKLIEARKILGDEISKNLELAGTKDDCYYHLCCCCGEIDLTIQKLKKNEKQQKR